MSGPRNEAVGRVVSVNTSNRKGVRKSPVAEVMLEPDLGVVGDAHAGPGDRQVSLLAVESIERQRRLVRERAADAECPKSGDLLKPGAFAENITTEGIELPTLPIGTRLAVGDALLEISRIGKECHRYCAIYMQLGDCVMPREGVFARVLKPGRVRPGDEVRLTEGPDACSDSDGQ